MEKVLDLAEWVYLGISVLLALYGLNAVLFALTRGRPPRGPRPVLPPEGAWPRVTIQLPIYNELYVVERLIDAVSALEWPRDRLEIQVLDDSEDETTRVAQARAEWHRRRGIDIQVLRRPERTGFKAGALAYGLAHAQGELIAIFDADFTPPSDFLLKTVPHLLADGRAGMVQTRWGHLNAEYNPLTRAQAIALDGHFAVEQAARNNLGLFLNFNGSGGIWRRTCIEEAGGWQDTTLCEDLDLSYRAQLRGWHFVFLPDVVSPAELPPQIQAYKRQQARWAQGSTQCLLKLGPALVRAPLPPGLKLEALLHLSGYVLHALLVILLLVTVPLLDWHTTPHLIANLFSVASFGPPLLYAVSQRRLYANWQERFRYFPVLMLLGIGLSFNNLMAVLRAVSGRSNTFRRTPKFRIEGRAGGWARKQYALPFSWAVFGELALALYALNGVSVAWTRGLYWGAIFLALYTLGFAYTAALTLLHALPAETKPGEQALSASQ